MYLTKAQLYEKVEQCRNRLLNCGVSVINISNICAAFDDIEVESAPFTTPGLRGMVSLATEDEPVHCIVINSLLPEEEQRFHSIHEFMHIVLHNQLKGRSYSCFDQIRPNQDRIIEWQANEGSAELLIPYCDFIPRFSTLFSDYQMKPDVWEILYGGLSVTDVLAQHYMVSVPVIRNRISTLAYEIDQYRCGIPLSELCIISHNKQNQCGIYPTDYLTIIAQIRCRYEFKPLEWNSVIQTE